MHHDTGVKWYLINVGMVVFFFVSEYDRFNGGQRSLLQLVTHLPSVGIKPIVLFPSKGRCYDAFVNAGVEIRLIRGSEHLMRFGQGLMRMSVFSLAKIFFLDIIPFSFRIYKEMKKEGASILHCNTTRSLLIGSIIPKVFGNKIIWHVRGELQSIRRPFLNLSERLSDKIILVAESLIDQIRAKSQHKCVAVYNAIDEKSFNYNYDESPILSFKKNYPNRLLVSTLAAVTPFKGYHHLIDAISIVNRELGDDAPIFVAVGELFDPKYVDHLEKQIADSNISNFKFLGWKDNPLPYYLHSDIIVLPTVQKESITIDGNIRQINTGEGLPRTVLEAMYLAKPVVATLVAGTSEQINDGESGILVPPSDSDQLAWGLIKLIQMSDKERRVLGDEACKRAKTVFGTERMLKTMKEVFQELS